MYRSAISLSGLATPVASRQFCPGDNFVTRRTKPTKTPGRQITQSVSVYMVIEIDQGGRSYNTVNNSSVIVIIREADIVGNGLVMRHSHGLHS